MGSFFVFQMIFIKRRISQMKCLMHGCEMVIKKMGVGWEPPTLGCQKCEEEEKLLFKITGREEVVFSNGDGWGRH